MLIRPQKQIELKDVTSIQVKKTTFNGWFFFKKYHYFLNFFLNHRPNPDNNPISETAGKPSISPLV